MPLARFGSRLISWVLVFGAAIGTAVAQSDSTYLGPTSVIASKDGKRLFVAEADASRIAVVDLAAGKVLQTIRVPAEPTGMALSPDGVKLYVTCAAPKSTVVVLDAVTGEQVGSIAAGHTACGPAISPDGKRLYVCNRFNNDVSVIDLAGGQPLARVPAAREPVAAAVTPDGRSVYVLNLLPNDRSDADDVAAAVTVIDTATNQPTEIRLPNGSSSVRGICISPDGKYAYVVHVLSRYTMPTTQLDRGWMNTNALSILDAANRKLVNTVLLDDVDLGAAVPWGVATTADGKTICVSHSGTHELSVIDAAGLMAKLSKAVAADVPNELSFLVGVRERIKLPGNGPRGLAIVGSTAYVADYFTDTLDIVDFGQGVPHSADTPPRIASIALGPKPQWSVARRGESLFHDATVCFQHWQSCASCHPDARVDGFNWDLMNDGLGNPKNTRNMLMVHRSAPAMALGVRESAEAGVRAGITHILFAVRPEADAKAMDEYLKGLKPTPSPHLIDGKLSEAAERGKQIFFDPKVGCAECHPVPLYTDMKIHDVGSRGKYDKPGDKFNTPRLIEAWRTAPYMHDGRYVDMKELLTKGNRDAKHGNTHGLSDKDIDDLVEFVLSL